MSREECNIAMMIGKKLESFEQDNDRVLLVCEDGSAFEMYHMQDCCEHVAVNDIKGELQSLVGSMIISTTEDVSGDWPADVELDYRPESFTWTTYTIQTAEAACIIRWLGQSNGYYSENVYFGMTHKPIKLAESPSLE